MSEFVVNASVAFKWLVEEENSDKATALTRLWDDEGAQLVGPISCLSRWPMRSTGGWGRVI